MYNMQELGTLLDKAISMLPTQLRGDGQIIWPHTSDAAQPMMRRWTSMLPLRHQGVLASALRGADGAPKEDPSKSVTSMIRRAVLNPADDRETTAAGGFFGFSAAKLTKNTHDFLHSMDQYPLHYVTHLMHACQIIGYKHPDECFRAYFELLYTMIVCKFHLSPEDMQTMDARLTADRIAQGTVERDYTPSDGLRAVQELQYPAVEIWKPSDDPATRRQVAAVCAIRDLSAHPLADMADPVHRAFISGGLRITEVVTHTQEASGDTESKLKQLMREEQAASKP